MLVVLNTLGTVLTSRTEGREAFLAFQPRLKDLGETEKIEIDFSDVTLSPGWADEFLTPLRKQLGERLVLRPSENPSVKATLNILQLNSSLGSYDK